MRQQQIVFPIMASCLLIFSAETLWASQDSPCQTARNQIQKGLSGDHQTPSTEGLPKGAGLRLINPDTGEMFPLPLPGVMSYKTFESMDTSHVGLYEEPDSGGGMKVNLQGRFQPMIKITPAPPLDVESDCAEPN